MRWTSGLRLRGMLGQNYVLLRPDRSGDLAIDQRSRLLLPANLLHYCGIGEERQVLLVAAFEHEILVVHPVCNMTDMVRTFHANQFERAVYGGVARGGH
ncbi:hypothetical protein ACRAKI_21730 [Saccharothrix isguenensis]